MSQHYFKYGIETARSRPGLAGLLYGVNLVVGLIVTVPIYLALSSATGSTGFAADMASQFDITLWTDVMEKAAPAFQALVGQLFWILPLYFLWKVASSVGIIHTLESRGVHSFWHGVGEHTRKAVLLGLVFLVPLIAIGIGVAILIVVLQIVWSGEAGSYWTFILILPVTLILGVALIDLMHDYARMELVIGRKPVMEAFIAGLKWPFQHTGSVGLYVGWFLLAGVVLLLPTIIDLNMSGLWLVFLVQQIVLFLRATMSVGWFGSEVLYYQTAMAEQEPMLANVEMGLGRPGDGSGEAG